MPDPSFTSSEEDAMRIGAKTRKSQILRWLPWAAPLAVVALLAAAVPLAHAQPRRPRTIPRTADPRVPPPDQRSAERQAYLEQQQRRMADEIRAVREGRVPREPAILPTMTAEQQRLSGHTVPAGAGFIIDEGPEPIGTKGAYAFKNRWAIKKGDTDVGVWAGVDLKDKQQGVLWYSETSRSHKGVHQAYPTPSKAGAVEVTGATGDVITLTATNGTTFRFDVASRTYLSP